MLSLFALREKNNAARLATVMAFAQDTNCLTRHLLLYFGETLSADCGHCGSCLAHTRTKGPRPIAGSPQPTLTLEHVAQIQSLIDEGEAALRAPRQIARFLCGITSPATTRDRLTRHDLFGLFTDHPFQSILEQTESMMIR
jgi:ATP-dependent DNA helicase RecQ